MNPLRILLPILLLSLTALAPRSAAQNVHFAREASDTTRITNILKAEAATDRPGNVTRIAAYFTDTPYGAGTLDRDSVETLTVNLDSLDCTTFVETVLALAYTAREYRQSWRDFTYNLARLRYRGGEENGYGSRLHYVSEWIVDNVARGNLREVTADIPGVRYAVKSLDYMSRHADAYPALANESNLQAIRNVESGYANHRFPYIKASAVKTKTLAPVVRDGDVVIFTTSIHGLDATHMGIIKLRDDGTSLLLHASSKAGKVLVDPLTLPEYVARQRPEGIRIVRLNAD